MRFAALGRTRMLYDSIHACVASGHEVVLIGTCPASPEYSKTEDDFARLAEAYSCPFFNDTAINRRKYIQLVQDSGAEVAISVNWLTLIKQPLIDQFQYGIINAHAGDLPRYRGNACPNWAILAGEKKVVVTLHQMSVDLDAGPILLQRECPLTSDTYIGDVYQFLYSNVPEMFAQALDGLASGSIIPREQASDPALSLRCFPRLPRDSEIDWYKSAEELARLVRASAEPFAGAYTFLNGEKLTIWRARADYLPYPYFGIPGQVVERRSRSRGIAVLTGEGVLILEEIETLLKGRRRAADIIKSMRVRLGMDMSQRILYLNERIEQLENKIQKLGIGKT